MKHRAAPAAVTFRSLIARRLTRRQVLEAGLALAPLAAGSVGLLQTPAVAANDTNTLRFQPIKGSKDDAVVLPRGYTFDIVARWGEALWSGSPDLDTSKLAEGALLSPGAADRQRRQFGQNCDAIHCFQLDRRGNRAVLCVNNEYTVDQLMFPGHPGSGGAAIRKAAGGYARRYREAVAVAVAAQGVSVIEVARRKGRWELVKDSRFNRRITADTPMEIGGPARGAALMKTAADPAGTRALGTFGNCAGGHTPWETYLTAEENIQDYFGNLDALRARNDVDARIVEAHRRFRMYRTDSLYGWENVLERFNLVQEPCEPFRFGWIVEIDPHDATRTPVKRTALGRFAHEGASPTVAPDGRVAVYMGDDDKFEHIYKFVSSAKFDAKNPAANRDLLDAGTLYVARFDASGRGQWLPLLYDPKGPLSSASGFADQAEVLIKARAAASALGATQMDRPEDVEVNPANGRIYVACTRNEDRAADTTEAVYAGRTLDKGPNIANPRGANPFGHIIEIREDGDDHTALEFHWEVFLLAGDPADTGGGRLITRLSDVEPGRIGPRDTYYACYAGAAELSPIGSPDNVGFDRAGNLWIVTDGVQPTGTNDGCWACPTAGPQRGRLQQFMSAPVGAEVCGCCFTPDGETLFLSIQHPGEGGSVIEPRSHWPDGAETQPRASVIAIRKDGGGVVGT
jgi:uncharacterized protein